ncbi:protoheme IX farnesyltransferase [Asticcacaulis sp. AC460]|uniref:heme o synthase n=1 Tax=Asticcacaulis sp. AC460 TaxID=1282360 RepID=UPI0003C3D23A|nr:heme o synthase [Asticcacaulis sp. AC460]ESQ89116.1 protoheme IX farnesyltransferase [Asticcacaulis sp. AC460]
MSKKPAKPEAPLDIATDLKQAYASQALRGSPGDYFQLLKPRVMSLVVFTALTGLIIAGKPIHPFLAFIAILCIALGAGAAGALNMALEGETDALMRRTKLRPVAAGRVTRNDALTFGGVLAFLSVFMMWIAFPDGLAAALLAMTIVYYVVLYTLVLKRRTPQNIVIGGAAGAFPPVIGWAAATGAAPWEAWILFAIIFLWTPPHSWALALYTAEDYAKAGIPMMPVAKGAKSTRLQILLYSLVMAPVACLPIATGLGGLVYGFVSVVGGAVFIYFALRVYLSRAGDHPEGGENSLYDVKKEALSARNLFAYSIFYLTALFATLLVEHLIKGVMS